MDFLTNAIGAILEAASHPFALLAYLAVLLAWVIVGLKVKRNSNLIKVSISYQKAIASRQSTLKWVMLMFLMGLQQQIG